MEALKEQQIAYIVELLIRDNSKLGIQTVKNFLVKQREIRNIKNPLDQVEAEMDELAKLENEDEQQKSDTLTTRQAFERLRELFGSLQDWENVLGAYPGFNEEMIDKKDELLDEGIALAETLEIAYPPIKKIAGYLKWEQTITSESTEEYKNEFRRKLEATGEDFKLTKEMVINQAVEVIQKSGKPLSYFLTDSDDANWKLYNPILDHFKEINNELSKGSVRDWLRKALEKGIIQEKLEK